MNTYGTRDLGGKIIDFEFFGFRRCPRDEANPLKSALGPQTNLHFSSGDILLLSFLALLVIEEDLDRTAIVVLVLKDSP